MRIVLARPRHRGSSAEFPKQPLGQPALGPRLRGDVFLVRPITELWWHRENHKCPQSFYLIKKPLDLCTIYPSADFTVAPRFAPRTNDFAGYSVHKKAAPELASASMEGAHCAA
jgi:hypothetical protein